MNDPKIRKVPAAIDGDEELEEYIEQEVDDSQSEDDEQRQ